MAEAEKKPANNPSLQKKTGARMAAVQCLYTAGFGEEKNTPAQAVARLKKQLEGNREEQKLQTGMALEPNYKLLERLLEGVHANIDEIDKRMDSVLSAEWKRERMSPLLIAILQCAIYEMFFDKEIHPKIVIDEYTRMTRSFFAEPEVNFVHGALSKLAEIYA